MASGVQDITCVFVEVAGSYEKKTLILQCPGMVCSPPVVSKCLGEAHRRLDIIYIIYITLLLFFFPILLVTRATDQQYGIRTKKSYLKTTRSCMDTPMNMYSSKGHIKRLTGAFFLADIQTMTYTQVHRYLGHASMWLISRSVIIEAWTFGYVAIIDSLTWHSILLMELMDTQHRTLLIALMDILVQHWQTG